MTPRDSGNRDKNRPNHNDRINTRKNKTHCITTRNEHGIQGKEHTEGKRNDRKTPFHGTMVDHGWNSVISILPAFEVLGCTESRGPVLHILCPLLLILDVSRMTRWSEKNPCIGIFLWSMSLFASSSFRIASMYEPVRQSERGYYSLDFFWVNFPRRCQNLSFLKVLWWAPWISQTEINQIYVYCLTKKLISSKRLTTLLQFHITLNAQRQTGVGNIAGKTKAKEPKHNLQGQTAETRHRTKACHTTAPT